jgi:hypothetical protein
MIGEAQLRCHIGRLRERTALQEVDDCWRRIVCHSHRICRCGWLRQWSSLVRSVRLEPGCCNQRRPFARFGSDEGGELRW